MTRHQLIRLIHIAKTQLKLDDETYRAALVAATGKSSCREMSQAELKTAYGAFVERGFKRRFKRDHQRVKPGLNGQPKAPEITKIRAIWITMYQQQFLVDGSEAALNQFVQRQTAKINGGVGVAEVGWLSDSLACPVLESLKQWHGRLMLKAMQARGQRLPERRGYDALCDAYSTEKPL
ncbi:regulatory protein GemA [Xenorhabdus sp. XENO-7]|uniref:Regulatory protein GemA n=1 Tax=Xenorhabdus aichiensis TaxID=3025874 RepID=A0ABT5LXF2_9GAMM|nr:regulatory protein GemA [Xenorhabdus aichiensis]MDC9620116.1 regulatory protein GemA [Xenorhabdus aichiensis]